MPIDALLLRARASLRFPSIPKYQAYLRSLDYNKVSPVLSCEGTRVISLDRIA